MVFVFMNMYQKLFNQIKNKTTTTHKVTTQLKQYETTKNIINSTPTKFFGKLKSNFNEANLNILDSFVKKEEAEQIYLYSGFISDFDILEENDDITYIFTYGNHKDSINSKWRRSARSPLHSSLSYENNFLDYQKY